MKKLLVGLFALLPLGLLAQSLYHLKVQGNVNPVTVRQMQTAIAEATATGAQVFVVEVDVTTGLLESADSIHSLLVRAPFQTVSYVSGKATSVGALVAVSCKEIYMAPGSAIGAATVLIGNTAELAPEKYQLHMRDRMRAAAELYQRNPKIAEKMADPTVSIPEIAPDNTTLTLSAPEAVRINFANGFADDLDQLISSRWKGYQQATYVPGWLYSITSFLTHPVVALILLMLTFIGIILEVKLPGVALPAGVALVSACLFFGPHYLEGLADAREIAVFVLGAILLAVEIFIIPGFGVVGIGGIALMFLGLIGGLVYNTGFDLTFVDTGELLQSASLVSVAFLVGIICAIWLARHLISIGYSSAILNADTLTGVSSISQKLKELIGLEGVATTELKPIGQANFNGRILDVQTKGIFLKRGSGVKIIALVSNQLIVEPIADSEPKPHPPQL